MPPRPARSTDPFPIAGVDEVGRGPLAGPVVAAAVVLDPRRPIEGLDDSKRLDAATRERLDALIRRRAHGWCLASASVEEIDRLNILHASLLAMRRAALGLFAGVERAHGAAPLIPADPFDARPGTTPPALVLVDGDRCPKLPWPSRAVVGGDARVRAIAAASILAKVARDALMREWHAHHPEYGFARHKGYATRTHREALARHGATPLHRRSFAPVRAALGATVATRADDPAAFVATSAAAVARARPPRTAPPPSVDVP